MITIYDFEFNIPGKTISPFAAKLRMALNYKDIPHRTVWLKDREIQTRAVELGLPINDLADPVPRYQVPTMHDSTTGISVSDSARIIAYLDKTYPNTPALIPAGTEAGVAALDSAVFTHMIEPLFPALAARTSLWQEEESLKVFRPAREALIGMTLEAYFADPSFERGIYEKAEKNWAALDRILEKARMVKSGGEEVADEGPFLTGSTLTYADLSVGSVLIWVKRILGDHEEPWDLLKGWNGGRWIRLYDALQQYNTI